QLSSVHDTLARNGFQTLQQRFRLFAAMGFYHSDDDVIAILSPCACALQHLIGLADPGRGADKDSELANTSFLSPGCLEQGLRRRALFRFAALICHQPSTLHESQKTRAFSIII